MLSSLIQTEIDRRGWTLRQLADAADLGLGTIGRIVNNQNPTPELPTLAALSKALDLPLRQLIEACGFPVEMLSADEQQERIRALVSAVPEFRLIIEPLSEMGPEQRLAVLAYIQGVRSQASDPQRRRRKG